MLPTMTADQVALAVNPDWDREVRIFLFYVMNLSLPLLDGLSVLPCHGGTVICR